MNILITGAQGFVGKNLASQLKNIRDGKAGNYAVSGKELSIFEYDLNSSPEELDDYCRKADFVFNLAGVNRPKDPTEFMQGNFGFASTLLSMLRKHGNTCPVMISSSIQAALDNPYGESKRAGEQLLFDYARETGAKVLAYRFPNLFGKWCRPNYNSVVATFCHNIAHDLPITVNDPSIEIHLAYIDDVVDELIAALSGREHREGDYCYIPGSHRVTLGKIAELLHEFRRMPETLALPDTTNGGFEKKLYSTYLSYLPTDRFAYNLKMNCDQRGSFTEIIRTADRGQVSVNISKPGITKGEHWHHTKNEKFVVVHGHGLIQLRKVGTDKNGNAYPVVGYEVSGENIRVVEMIPGYTHNIINLSDTEDLVTVMWANESFDPKKPDTYFEPVEND